MSALAGHGKAKYVTGRRRASSEGRGWSGLLAERWCHSEGDLGAVRPRETEVIVMLEGRLRIRRRGDGQLQHHEAGPGTVWLCPAGIAEDMIHLYGEIPDSVHMYLPAEPLSGTALAELDIDPAQVRLRYDGGFRDPLIEQIGRAVQAELAAPGPAGAVLVDTLAQALSVHVLRHHSNLAPGRLPLPRADGALDRLRLARVLDYIETHLDEDLTLARLAEAACLSPFHFARAFKAATGQPPHRYLVQRRLARARTLLAGTGQPLASVAAASGFSSQAHFTRTFRQAMGMTPGAYRAVPGAAGT